MPRRAKQIKSNIYDKFTVPTPASGVLVIPITSKEKIKKKPDYAVVLAWNFFEEIKKKNSSLAHKFISIKDLEA